MPRGASLKYYTVYLSSTDEVIAYGTSIQCAKKMNMTIGSFYCAVDRSRSGKRKKYVFIEEEITAKEYDEYNNCL
jgi:hypothetical protein